MSDRDRGNPYTLVYVLGAGHCGSTLLGLLLNGHSRVLGLGEIVSVGDYGPWNDETRKQRELETPLWRDISACYERTTGSPFSDLDLTVPRVRAAWRMDAPAARQWATPSLDLFRCAANVSGADVLVDASKWSQRLRLLLHAGTAPAKVIHLTRDGRGVVYSYRLRGASFWGGLFRWADPTLASILLRHKAGKHNWLRVRYEDLASDPEAVLRRICAFLGLEFEPEMLRWREHESFAIGGNTMRYRFDDTITRDERWRSAMSRSDRVKFAVLGGWLNWLSGY